MTLVIIVFLIGISLSCLWVVNTTLKARIKRAEFSIKENADQIENNHVATMKRFWLGENPQKFAKGEHVGDLMILDSNVCENTPQTRYDWARYYKCFDVIRRKTESYSEIILLKRKALLEKHGSTTQTQNADRSICYDCVNADCLIKKSICYSAGVPFTKCDKYQPKKSIYISGRISGLDKAVAEGLFKAAQKFLEEKWTVVNPMLLPAPTDASWSDYMRIDIKALCDCDAIFLLDNWTDSKGAQLEFEIAKQLGFKIMLEAHHESKKF